MQTIGASRASCPNHTRNRGLTHLYSKPESKQASKPKTQNLILKGANHLKKYIYNICLYII